MSFAVRVFFVVVVTALLATIIGLSGAGLGIAVENKPVRVSGQMLTTLSGYSQPLNTTDGLVKLQGLDTANNLAQVEFFPNGRLQYKGSSPVQLTVGMSVAFESTPASTILMYVAVNGLVLVNATPQVGSSQANTGFGTTLSTSFLYTAEPNDYFEIYVTALFTNTTLGIDQYGSVLYVKN